MTAEPSMPVFDPVQQQRFLALTGRATQLLSQSYAKQLQEALGNEFQMIDGKTVSQSFQEFGVQLLSDPVRLAQAQASLWKEGLALWGQFMTGAVTGQVRPVVQAPAGDRRFKDDVWNENPAFVMMQQGYLLYSKWLQDLIDNATGLDPKTHQRVKFFTRQYLNALSPSNCPFTNPLVLKHAQETGGRSLLDGLEHFLDDLERGGGHLKITMADEDAFAIGRNLALTPGKVIYRNDLIELIQYSPSTEQVHERPLLFIPAWINKFYILDLQPKNSMIKWLVDEGFTVFLMSWVNPTKELAHKRFEDYLTEGPLAAMDAIEEQLGVREVGAIGYCIGGILLTSGLAHLAAKKDERIKSATFLVTLFDFADDVGELGVFIDAAHLDAMEAHTQETGFLEGRHLANTFAMLRENDLIWSFFVNNYLMGREPAPFDLLYWNADATRLPAQMLSDYARGFYLNNSLANPGTMSVLGTPIDTRKVTTPAYAAATREDHLAPWRSCYPVRDQFSGPVRFCLGGSGHIAGIMNQAGSKKYGYWINDEPAANADAWFEAAEHRPGSWWPDWSAWLKRYAGDLVPARDPAAGPMKPLCDAPGTYVHVKPEDD